mmetsp:Transcript_49656/g.124563  ORF Transcript_49656/g.124563 Transcript_49656/m.124563 type:complete len:102 (-) Transcript_49656:147-452(-)
MPMAAAWCFETSSSSVILYLWSHPTWLQRSQMVEELDVQSTGGSHGCMGLSIVYPTGSCILCELGRAQPVITMIHSRVAVSVSLGFLSAHLLMADVKLVCF